MNVAFRLTNRVSMLHKHTAVSFPSKANKVKLLPTPKLPDCEQIWRDSRVWNDDDTWKDICND